MFLVQPSGLLPMQISSAVVAMTASIAIAKIWQFDSNGRHQIRGDVKRLTAEHLKDARITKMGI